MKVLGHLLIADSRRFRLLIVTTVVVVVASVIVDGWRPLVAIDLRTSEALNAVAGLLWLTELLLMLSVIPLVIQSDAVVGSDAFWMTRPVAPRVLLAEKAILLGLLFVAVPVLTEVGLMAAHAVPAGAMRAIAVQSSLEQLLWVALFMTGAALTRSLARFALLCGGVLLTFAGVLATMTFVLMGRFDGAVPFASGPAMYDRTAAVAALLCLLLIGVTTLEAVYRTRSRWLALAGGVAATAVAWLVMQAWPLVGFARPGDLPERADAIALKLDPASVTTNVRPFDFSRAEPWGETRGRVWVAGIPAGWTATIAMMAGELVLSNGQRIPSEGGGPTSQLAGLTQSVSDTTTPAESTIRRVTRQVLDVDQLADFMPPSDESTMLLRLKQGTLDRVAPTVGQYRATFNVALSQYGVEAVLPLKTGATYRNGPYRIVIDGVRFQSGQASIVARQSNASWLWAARQLPTYRYFLRNPARREAIAGGGYDFRAQTPFARIMPFGWSFTRQQQTGFHTTATRMSFPPGYGMQGAAFDLDDAWMRDAELVIVTTAVGGEVARPLAASDVPLQVSPRPRSTLVR